MSETSRMAQSGAGAGQALRLAARAAGICVLTQGTDMRYGSAENLPPPLRRKWRPGCAEEDLFPAEFAAQMRRVKQRILAAAGGGQPARQTDSAEALVLALKGAGAGAKAAAAAGEESAEYHAGQYLSGAHLNAGGGRDLWLKFSVSACHDVSGRLSGFVSTGVNISELRGREELMRALLREVSHRSKNLLAIIQSIAAQTARFSGNIAVFLQKFQGRLHSLASSQDLVTESDWRGARLRDLIHAQTHFYAEAPADGQSPGCEIRCGGQNPYLFPSAALHIGLALHELTVNSAAFGALARGAGSIKISCEKVKAAAEKTDAELLRLCWRETFAAAENCAAKADAAEQKTGAEQIPPPEAEGEAAALPQATAARAAAGQPGQSGAEDKPAHFGRAVLERIVPAAVSGKAKYAVTNSSIEYCIDIPSDNYSKKDRNDELIYHI